MKVVTVGPGAMGCLFTTFLAEAGLKVLLLDHDSNRANLLNKTGLFIEGISGEHHVKVPVTASPEAADGADLILVCVKSYSTGTAVNNLVPVLKPEARVLTLQNGIGNVEILGEKCGLSRVWGGVTSQGATLLEPGHVRHAGTGPTIIGAASGPGQESRLTHVADLFTKAGIPTSVESKVETLIWSKLIVNVGINTLTAITRLKNGMLLDYPGTEYLMEMAVNEAVSVTRAKGIEPIFPDPVEHVKSVARATAGNIASMLQDILAKRKTEIDSINGAVVTHGQRLGISTPVNETLTALVKTIEASYDETV